MMGSSSCADVLLFAAYRSDLVLSFFWGGGCLCGVGVSKCVDGWAGGCLSVCHVSQSSRGRWSVDQPLLPFVVYLTPPTIATGAKQNTKRRPSAPTDSIPLTHQPLKPIDPQTTPKQMPTVCLQNKTGGPSRTSRRCCTTPRTPTGPRPTTSTGSTSRCVPCVVSCFD
jgi:hypothetical protein